MQGMSLIDIGVDFHSSQFGSMSADARAVR